MDNVNMLEFKPKPLHKMWIHSGLLTNAVIEEYRDDLGRIRFRGVVKYGNIRLLSLTKMDDDFPTADLARDWCVQEYFRLKSIYEGATQ